MTDAQKKQLCFHALDNLDDCIWQTVKEISDTDSPETAANLSVGLDQLDTGVLRVRELLNAIPASVTI